MYQVFRDKVLRRRKDPAANYGSGDAGFCLAWLLRLRLSINCMTGFSTVKSNFRIEGRSCVIVVVGAATEPPQRGETEDLRLGGSRARQELLNRASEIRSFAIGWTGR